MNLVSGKNYVVANAVDAILSAAKNTNIAQKNYLHKSDYGQVPKYLSAIKTDISKEYDTIRKLKQAEDEGSKAKVKLLPEEERRRLIEALKAKWEKVNIDYQATTHMTKLDTIGKIRRKEQYERQLAEIERDLEKLGKGYIFVDQEH
jgi:predicted transcriptional regulator